MRATRANPKIPRAPLVFAASLMLAFGLAGAAPPAARAETVQSCRRRGCRLNVNTYRCICPRQRVRPRSKWRLRCPRGTRRSKFVFKHRAYRRRWGTVYRCVKRRRGKDIAHGPAVKLWPNGVLRFRGRYVNGKEQGPWKWYDQQGNLWWSEHYVSGKRHGLYRRWYPALKKIQTEGQYREGLQVGLWKSWHKNDKLRELGRYVKGKRDGVWTSYHPNGKKRMETPYKRGREEGIRKIWSAGGKLVETCPYVHGYRHGKKWSIRSGHKTVTHFRRGEMHGPDRAWHTNGKLARETSYYHNLITGLDRKWNRRAVRLLRRHYLNGQLHGLSERWYDNGKLRERGRYLKGRKTGEWVQYAPDGSEISRHTY